jgi:A/G-specific adenine glycosylase
MPAKAAPKKPAPAPRHGSDALLNLDSALAAKLHGALVAFYRAQAKDLPWRRSRDPWAIWISEIMLQQTQVETVVPRFGPFLRQFPTVAALAAAPVEAVCEAWAGLGYYRRARSLHAAAQDVVHNRNGEIPQTLDGLLNLAGVGRYTAGAIASIAYGQHAPIVDGNVVRVLGRVFLLQETLATPAGRRIFWGLAERLVQGGPASAAGAFNQAMMELGRTVCTPRAPTCMLCPLRPHCGAYRTGAQLQYPQVVAKPAKVPLPMVFAWRQDKAGLWLWQRPVQGLWAGLWELPSGEGAAGPRTLGLKGIALGAPIAQITHVLTHRHVTASICRGLGTAAQWRRAGATPVADPLAAPLSSLARKAIVAAQASMV